MSMSIEASDGTASIKRTLIPAPPSGDRPLMKRGNVEGSGLNERPSRSDGALLEYFTIHAAVRVPSTTQEYLESFDAGSHYQESLRVNHREHTININAAKIEALRESDMLVMAPVMVDGDETEEEEQGLPSAQAEEPVRNEMVGERAQEQPHFDYNNQMTNAMLEEMEGKRGTRSGRL